MKKILVVGENAPSDGVNPGALATSMDREMMQGKENELVTVYGQGANRLDEIQLRSWLENVIPDHLVFVRGGPTQDLRPLLPEYVHGVPSQFSVHSVEVTASGTFEAQRQELRDALVDVIC